MNYASESSDLIDWADVAMFWGTSMALEAYMKDKVCVCLNHLHANTNNFAQHNAGWIVNSRDDLLEALVTLSRDADARPYDQANVSAMLKNMVYGGYDTKDSIPDRYLEYIREQSA